MSHIVNLMLAVMDFIYGVVGNWGVTIMGLTILVRLVVLPLTILQGRSASRMALIQPELDKLQKKYADDPERLNLEIMDLYRRHKVNPASSCLLPFIQLPILWAMIRALEAHEQMKGASFFGLILGEPAMKQGTGYGVVVVGFTVLTTYLAMRLSPAMATGQQQEGQNAMLLGMLAFMAYFSIRFATAVSVYIITANLFGLVERLAIPRGETTGEGARSK
ncbi:MAG: YidC/Oxa1 family membrane protein insertase [Bacillota bacterium]|jgi:YidC/Oxa1 family membrane protein insertase|nr:YidC/Oxa1 family membrane protein insertase [Candidatus Fermentithermobacillaceae bacterium]